MVQRWGTVTPEDQSLVNRVVGTLEYLSSLRNLDAFLRSASREEIEAADKIVTSRPQFTVFTQLSDRFRRGVVAQPTSPGSPIASQKQGLMWVVALARLEAGAILGTFTSFSNPFEVVGPTQWEMPAYREMLMDGAQTHFLALANDANVNMVAMKTPGAEMLAYIRRLNLARAMLNAAARSNVQQLSLPEWAQLEEQDRQLLSMRDRFSQRINWQLMMLNNSRVDKSVSEKLSASVQACTLQLAGERRELAAGTAKVQVFMVK